MIKPSWGWWSRQICYHQLLQLTLKMNPFDQITWRGSDVGGKFLFCTRGGEVLQIVILIIVIILFNAFTTIIIEVTIMLGVYENSEPGEGKGRILWLQRDPAIPGGTHLVGITIILRVTMMIILTLWKITGFTKWWSDRQKLWYDNDILRDYQIHKMDDDLTDSSDDDIDMGEDHQINHKWGAHKYEFTVINVYHW